MARPSFTRLARWPTTHPLRPPTLYGVFRQANEGTAQIYWQEHSVSSIGLRPYVVYGPWSRPGHDLDTHQGHACGGGRPALPDPPTAGTPCFQHADDAAESFIRAARQSGSGAPVYTLGGNSASMADIVAAIEAAAPQVRGKITFTPIQLPNPEDVDSSVLDATLGPIHWAPLNHGVKRTIEHFQSAVELGRIDAERAIA